MAKPEVTAELVDEAIAAYEWAEGRMAFKGGMAAALERALSLLFPADHEEPA